MRGAGGAASGLTPAPVEGLRDWLEDRGYTGLEPPC
jgi:hypothetical protein